MIAVSGLMLSALAYHSHQAEASSKKHAIAKSIFSPRMSPEKEKEFFANKKKERAIFEVRIKNQVEETKARDEHERKMEEAKKKGDQEAIGRLMKEEQEEMVARNNPR